MSDRFISSLNQEPSPNTARLARLARELVMAATIDSNTDGSLKPEFKDALTRIVADVVPETTPEDMPLVGALGSFAGAVAVMARALAELATEDEWFDDPEHRYEATLRFVQEFCDRAMRHEAGDVPGDD